MKLSNLVYGAAGYVLGARAGRDRYDQIVRARPPGRRQPDRAVDGRCRAGPARPDRGARAAGRLRAKITGQPAAATARRNGDERLPPQLTLGAQPARRIASRAPIAGPHLRGVAGAGLEPRPPRHAVAAGLAARDEAHRSPADAPAARTARCCASTRLRTIGGRSRGRSSAHRHRRPVDEQQVVDDVGLGDDEPAVAPDRPCRCAATRISRGPSAPGHHSPRGVATTTALGRRCRPRTAPARRLGQGGDDRRPAAARGG